ncbi:MAG: hypothetical protein J5J06_10945 [Phycisphaerae bacterium]|nr:hypothetical protein [Phycisphaerae bacterium]
MKVKTIGTVFLLAFVAVSVAYLVIDETGNDDTPAAVVAEKPALGVESRERAPGGGQPAPANPENQMAQSAPRIESSHKVIAYYFHNTQRCMTCNKIERLSEEALREKFATALNNGDLEWRVINMEEPPNTHFVEDFHLVASSLVLVDLHDGQQRAWTNMEKVWQYVHDDEAQFKQYVADQTRKYLES